LTSLIYYFKPIYIIQKYKRKAVNMNIDG